jgi:hypothetical protein
MMNNVAWWSLMSGYSLNFIIYSRELCLSLQRDAIRMAVSPGFKKKNVITRTQRNKFPLKVGTLTVQTQATSKYL